jgi:hypothetical protein
MIGSPCGAAAIERSLFQKIAVTEFEDMTETGARAWIGAAFHLAPG